MPNGDVEKLFWEWAEETYPPEAVEVLRRYTKIWESNYMDYFLNQVYYPQTGIKAKPTGLALGRPQPEKYGLTDTDWQTLMAISGSSERTQKELERWIESGYINRFQARDIWDEMAIRVQQGRVQTFLGESPADKARREALEKREEQARIQERYRALPLSERVGPERYKQMMRRRAWFGARPETRYGPELEELRAGFEGEIPQTERWQDWFRSKYPRLVEQFEAQLPSFTMAGYQGLRPEEARKQIQRGWAEYLRKRKPQLKEEFYKLSPYQRGERPSAFAPRIQTIGF